MTVHLERDLALLKDRVLAQGGLVEEALERATKALTERRADMARAVLEHDDAIDRMELEVDEECLKLLALHQPVAGDLRFITAVMKINNDLERIGDLAVNIAERALDLTAQVGLDEQLGFDEMTATCRWMLRNSLDALVAADSQLARQVCERDDVVDDINRRHFKLLMKRLSTDVGSAPTVLDYLTTSLHLERVADLATNIAEDVIFMVEALDVRHRGVGQDAPHGS